jgi:hypothetical protein
VDTLSRRLLAPSLDGSAIARGVRRHTTNDVTDLAGVFEKGWEERVGGHPILGPICSRLQTSAQGDDNRARKHG